MVGRNSTRWQNKEYDDTFKVRRELRIARIAA
jgi:hypothetical protein